MENAIKWPVNASSLRLECARVLNEDILMIVSWNTTLLWKDKEKSGIMSVLSE